MLFSSKTYRAKLHTSVCVFTKNWTHDHNYTLPTELKESPFNKSIEMYYRGRWDIFTLPFLHRRSFILFLSDSLQLNLFLLTTSILLGHTPQRQANAAGTHVAGGTSISATQQLPMFTVSEVCKFSHVQSSLHRSVNACTAGFWVKYQQSNCVWLEWPLWHSTQHRQPLCSLFNPLVVFPLFSRLSMLCYYTSPICFSRHKQCVFSLAWPSSIMEDVTVPLHYVSCFFLRK